MDRVAYVTATRHAGANCVAASFDRVDFIAPVHVGDLAEFVATVTFVGRSAMEVWVEVRAEDLRGGPRRLVGNAYVTMVALDDDGRPRSVPAPHALRADAERRRFQDGERRMAVRRETRAHGSRGHCEELNVPCCVKCAVRTWRATNAVPGRGIRSWSCAPTAASSGWRRRRRSVPAGSACPARGRGHAGHAAGRRSVAERDLYTEMPELELAPDWGPGFASPARRSRGRPRNSARRLNEKKSVVLKLESGALPPSGRDGAEAWSACSTFGSGPDPEPSA